jgi:hypothetical protein
VLACQPPNCWQAQYTRTRGNVGKGDISNRSVLDQLPVASSMAAATVHAAVTARTVIRYCRVVTPFM